MQTLANPWFEGNPYAEWPAAEYIAWHLDQAGCQPMFETTDDPVIKAMWTTNADGPPGISHSSSMRA